MELSRGLITLAFAGYFGVSRDIAGPESIQGDSAALSGLLQYHSVGQNNQRRLE